MTDSFCISNLAQSVFHLALQIFRTANKIFCCVMRETLICEKIWVEKYCDFFRKVYIGWKTIFALK